jgi:hypothetical protein
LEVAVAAVAADLPIAFHAQFQMVFHDLAVVVAVAAVVK